MKRSLIPILAVSAVLLGACGAAETPASKTAPSSSTTASPTPSAEPVTVDQAYDTLSQGHVKSPCAPTKDEMDRLITSVTDEDGATETEARAFTEHYLEGKCTEAKTLAAVKAEERAVKDKSTYHAISKRALAKVIRDPDSYIGKKYVVYAEVTQFDAATGTDTFRGDVAHADIRDYGYWIGGENAMFEAGAADLDDVVQDDIVRMYVTVAGTLSYDTQIGGNTTVPQFTVNIIKRIGQSK